MNPHGLILPARIVGGFLLCLAAVPCAIGLWLYSRSSAFLETAVSAQGTVVEVQPSSGSGDTTYHSVFEFQDRDGTTHRTTSAWSSNPPAHTVGEQVEVLYPPNRPSEAKIKGFMSSWFLPVLCLAFTLVPVLFGTILIWLIPLTIRRVWPRDVQEQALPGR